MMTSEEELAVLVHEATLCRETIANLKDTLASRLWEEYPPKHRKIREEYEPSIKKHAYRLADIEARLRELKPQQEEGE